VIRLFSVYLLISIVVLNCFLPFSYSENWDIAKQTEFHCVYTPDKSNFIDEDIVIYLIKSNLIYSLLYEFDFLEPTEENAKIKRELQSIDENINQYFWFLVERYSDSNHKLIDYQFLLENNIRASKRFEYSIEYKTDSISGSFIYGDKKPLRSNNISLIYNDVKSQDIFFMEKKKITRILLGYDKKNTFQNRMDIQLYENERIFNTFERRKRCSKFNFDE
jgi:hypothetical protein